MPELALAAEVAQTTPVPAVPAAEMISLAEAQRRADAVAAAARKQTETEWQTRFDAELSARDVRLAEFEAAEQARKDQDLTDLERERKAREAAAAEAAAKAAEAQELRDELEGTRKRTQVSTLIAASTTRIPSRYHPDVYTACLAAEAINPETVESALAEAKAAWEADMVSYGIKPEATPALARNVGTSTAPPANQPAVAQSDAERAEMVKGLTLAYMGGDMEAGKKLDALYGTKR